MTSENPVLDEGTPAPVADKTTPYIDERTGVTIDPSRDENVTEFARATLTGFYMDQQETVQERYSRAAKCYSSNPEHAQRLYEGVSKGYFMFASPPLSNATLPGEKMRGLPISCFLNEPDDTVAGLIEHLKETEWLTVMGGGVGGFWNTRSESLKSSGLTPFQNVIDSLMGAFSQGKCYAPGTEVLTNKGWRDLRHITKKDMIAQVSDSGVSSFTHPLDVICEDHDGELVEISGNGGSFRLSVTPNHSMVIERENTSGWSGKLVKVRADEIKYHRNNRHHVAARMQDSGGSISPEERFLIALQADGSICKKQTGEQCGFKRVGFHLKKQRKIDRLLSILAQTGYEFKKTPQGDAFDFQILVPTSKIVSKNFVDWVDLSEFDAAKAEQFMAEVRHWDATDRTDDSFTFMSVHEENSDLIQAIAVMAGYRTRKASQEDRGENKQTLHTIYVRTKYAAVGGDSIKKSTRTYSGKVYCALVPEGKLLVRYKGQVSVCGNTRRGSYASYVRIDHPNFPEFLTIRTPTGDEGRKCHGTGYHHGAVIPDAFMKAVEADGDWDLIDPHSKEVKKTVKARELWEQMLDVRYRTGEPYMFFEENAQAGLHSALKVKGLRVKASNLCAEIMLPTTPDRTAVCCLSSLNCETADEWPPTLIPDLIEMLDNILTIFIENAPPELWRAVASAKAERSVGLGLMGFHSYLQKNGIPFESQKARDINIELFHRIKAEAEAASLVLGGQRGEPEDLKGTGRRNAHLLAIAPNANSGILLGTSPSIEPNSSNAYVHRTRAGSFPVQNKHLMALLETKGRNTPDVWKQIINSKGSVQELPFLSSLEKMIFKTASELDQKWIVIHAADRQPYVCQGQSVNLFFPAGYDRNKFSYVHWLAWKKGLKSLYYVRTVAGKRADNLSTQAERFEHATYKKERLHKRVWKGIKRAFTPRVDWGRKGETEDEKALNVDQELFENEQPQPIVVAGCAINGDQIEVGGSVPVTKSEITAEDLANGPITGKKIDKSKDDIWAKAESGQESSCAACEG